MRGADDSRAQPAAAGRTTGRRWRRLRLATWLLCFSGSLAAAQADLDRAIERYYAGAPLEAIEMLKPIALAGDAAAQYLLGNIVYGLVQAGRSEVGEDPVRWYQMAAAQGFADASYALGAIYNNRWLKDRRIEDARLAEYYFQQALDRGQAKAQGPLLKLAAHNRAAQRSNSLTYTNSSFASKQASTRSPATQSTGDALARFTTSGDPIADAVKLETMLQQLGTSEAIENPGGGGNWPDEAALIRMLDGLGADSGMVSDLVRLLGHLRTSRELNLVPGAN